jgi:UDP-4-amino-4,6-dideoxy-N-acetyl-beta-L-altrosamine N-acetyltransferase
LPGGKKMIKGKKIILRKLEEKDLERVLGWINDPEIATTVGIEQPISLDEQKVWYKKLLGDRRKRVFAIELKDTGEHIGNISIDSIDWKNRNARIAIFIGDREKRRQGFGQDSIMAGVDYCFDYLNLHRVYLTVHSDNQPAIALYKRCGFKEEGRLRKHEYRKGRYVDMIIMGILKEEI